MFKNLIKYSTFFALIFFIFFFVNKDSGESEIRQMLLNTESQLSELSDILMSYDMNLDREKFSDQILSDFVSSHGNTYTEYINSTDSKVFFETVVQGDFEWIGAFIEESPQGVYILDVIPGSPAQIWGLLPGDVIETVNGVSMLGVPIDTAMKHIRWPTGSAAVMDIYSTLLGHKKQVTLIRSKLEIPIIRDTLEKDILIIHLLSFNDHSGELVEKTLKQYEGKYTSVLLDLRNNWWGTLQAAVDVGSLFIAKDKLIASIHGKDPKNYVSHGTGDFSFPVSLLINGQTASSAEILAAAIKTHLWSKVYGAQSYGKWSVQELMPLSNGGYLKITTSTWHTASGEKLDGIGIKPDEIVLPTVEDISTGVDGQRKRVLEKIIQNTL